LVGLCSVSGQLNEIRAWKIGEKLVKREKRQTQEELIHPQFFHQKSNI